jgi:hypothetical protein
VVLILALVANPVLAQDQNTPDYFGVWEGRVGSYPVVACLWADRDWIDGAYYYKSSLRPIGLLKDGGTRNWAERVNLDENGAIWSGIKVEGDHLSANWSQGERSLAIELDRREWTSMPEFDRPCESDTFLDPLAQGGSIAESAAELDGIAYTKLAYVSPDQFEEGDATIETFALHPQRPGDAAINTILRLALPDGTHASELMQCMGLNISHHGTFGFKYQSAEPTVFGRDLLIVRESNDVYCGGAHPSSWWYWRVFDRRSGVEIYLADWFNDSAANPRDPDWQGIDYSVGLKAPLRDQVLTHWEEDREECNDAIERPYGWIVGVSRDGMSFTPDFPRVIMAYAQEMHLGWDELGPFLSDLGRAGQADLQAD